jgi:hypothetical protein
MLWHLPYRNRGYAQAVFAPFAAPRAEAFRRGWVDKPGIFGAAQAGFPLKLQPGLHKLL